MTAAPFELWVERRIDAPPDRVWQVMTGRLAEWWCPKPWTTTIIENDMRAGGSMRMVMRGPDGQTSSGETEESPLEGVYLEVTPGTRLVFTNVVQKRGDGDWLPQPPFMIGCLEVSPDGDGTHYRASARHWNEAAMKQHQDMGFADGWRTVADQLAALSEAP